MSSQEFDLEATSVKRKLISFSYLAQASKNNGDLIGGVTSIFKPIAKLKTGEIFQPVEFCEIVSNLYGLKIHPWAAEDLVDRLEKNGLLVKNVLAENVVEYYYAEIKEEFSAVTEKDIKFLIVKFIAFSQPILDQHNIQLNEEELTESFLDHLTDLDFIATALRPSEYSGLSKSQNTLTVNREKIAWKEKVETATKINLLCAGFVLDAYHSHSELYELIVNIVSGALVAETVLNFQEPASNINLSLVSFVLDTPLLMSYLNLSCEKEHEFSKQLFEEVISLGGTLAVFEHSVDELRDNLKAVLHRKRERTSFGATSRRLSNPNFCLYLDQVLNDPSSILAKVNVRIFSDISSSTSLNFFSEDDEKALCSTFGFYSNKLAQERDASSISQVMRYRNGITTSLKAYHKCRYIFLTENSFIPNKAMSFLVKNEILSKGLFPPAVSGRYISGLLWVQFGGKGKDLSRQLLLANCAAALEPTSDVVKDMHKMLDDMDPLQAELFGALMGEERAGQYLMQYSLGDASLLTKDNSPIILEKLYQSLLEKHEAEKSEALESLESELKDDMESSINSVKEHYKKLLEKRALEHDELKGKLFEADQTVAMQSAKMDTLEKSISSIVDDIDLNKTRKRRKIIRKIEKIMVAAKIAQGRFQGLVVFSFFLCVLLVTMYSSEYIENYEIRLLVVFLTSVLSTIGFWYMPALILGKLSIWYRDSYFWRTLEFKELHVDEESMLLNWDQAKVSSIEDT
jgi:hypothetical protein